MLKRIIQMAAIIIALAGVSQAYGAMEFHADFARSGVYENSWPMIAGEVATVDIYVSNVPDPGLFSMGFKLVYDAGKMEVLAGGAGVDAGNWPNGGTDLSDGSVDMYGFRLGGLSGNNIRLGWVVLRCKETGSSDLTILDRDGDWFVLDTQQGEVVLDSDLGVGVVLAAIRPPLMGDVNGDQFVNLADAIAALQEMVQIDSGPHFHANADCNGDGAVGLAEILYALRKAAGLP